MVNIVNVGFDYSRLIVYTRLCEQKKKKSILLYHSA